MKALLGLLLLLALLVGADRLAAGAAEDVIAERLGPSLEGEPQVDVRGFPFLLQAVRGRYDDIAVTAAGLDAGETRLRAVEARLRGVRVPLSAALSRDVAEVPVESVEARVLLPFAELERRSERTAVTVEPAGDRVRVTGELTVLRQTLTASAVSRVELDRGDVVVTAERYEVGAEAADEVLTRLLGDRLDLRLPVAGLPYGLVLDGVAVEPGGVRLTAAATDTVVRPG